MRGRSHSGPRRYLLAVITTISMFAVWGFAQRIHSALTPQFEQLFNLSSIEASWTQSVLGIAYMVLAIPSAMFLRRLGYKSGVVFGLSGFALGAFLLYPAIAQHKFAFYLAAVAVIGGSWAMLETCANPLFVQMGPPETAVRRLNFAQSFYPIGLFIGVWLGPKVFTAPTVFVGTMLVQQIVRPYVIAGLCVVLLAFLIDHLEFPSVATEVPRRNILMRQELRILLSRHQFRFSAIALCAYIVAQSCIWGEIVQFSPRQLAQAGISGSDVLLFSWLVYGAGRFVGTGFMYLLNPFRLLALFAGIALFMMALAAGVGGFIAAICLTGTSFFMSIMFPTIFAGGIAGLGALTKSASGILVAATGTGVTIAAMILGIVWPVAPSAGFAVPSLCFAVVMAYAFSKLHTPTTNRAYR